MKRSSHQYHRHKQQQQQQQHPSTYHDTAKNNTNTIPPQTTQTQTQHTNNQQYQLAAAPSNNNMHNPYPTVASSTATLWQDPFGAPPAPTMMNNNMNPQQQQQQQQRRYDAANVYQQQAPNMNMNMNMMTTGGGGAPYHGNMNMNGMDYASAMQAHHHQSYAHSMAAQAQAAGYGTTATTTGSNNNSGGGGYGGGAYMQQQQQQQQSYAGMNINMNAAMMSMNTGDAYGTNHTAVSPQQQHNTNPYTQQQQQQHHLSPVAAGYPHNTKPSSSNNNSTATTTAAAASNLLVPPPQMINRSRVAGRCRMLGIAQEDPQVLNGLQCLIRLHCIEVFSATLGDIRNRPRGKGSKHVGIGQVGIRCIHCRHLPSNAQTNQAVSFPSSLSLVYESVRNWQRFHFTTCTHIPAAVRSNYDRLKAAGVKAGESRHTTRQYFAESAKTIGLVDTPMGIYFADDDLALADGSSITYNKSLPNESDQVTKDVLGRILAEGGGDDVDGKNRHRLVRPEDRSLVTDFTFLLYSQMQRCEFITTEGDDKKYKHHSEGFPGIECRHCASSKKRERKGRYFPSSEKGLSDASFSQSVYSHMMKCQKCPQNIKHALARLRSLNSLHISKIKRGLKKVFLSKLWERLHDLEPRASSNDLMDTINEINSEMQGGGVVKSEATAAGMDAMTSISASNKNNDNTMKGGTVVVGPDFAAAQQQPLALKSGDDDAAGDDENAVLATKSQEKLDFARVMMNLGQDGNTSNNNNEQIL